MKKAALTNVCLPKLHLQREKKKSFLCFLISGCCLMAPKTKERTCREITTSIIPVVTDKASKAVPQPNWWSTNENQPCQTCPWPCKFSPCCSLLCPLCAPPEGLVEVWAGRIRVLPFCSSNTHRSLFVFKHFSGFFIAARFFYAFPLEVPRNNLFQPV